MTTDAPTKVGDLMSTEVCYIDREATVQQAIELLRENTLTALIVKKQNDQDEFGMVTVTDIAREVIGKRRAPERTYVFEIMSKPAVTLPAQMKPVFATRLLANFDLSQAIVIDDSWQLVGIVSRRDLVFACLDSSGQ